jgi:hypothetical protein
MATAVSQGCFEAQQARAMMIHPHQSCHANPKTDFDGNDIL